MRNPHSATETPDVIRGDAVHLTEAQSAWYVARTKPLKEHQAAATLAQRGIEVFLPMLLKSKRRAGRRDREPLFAGYLFASLDISANHWLSARSAPDIAYFLCQDGRPIALPEGFVPALRERVGWINGQRSGAHFLQGDRVTITEGPFQYMDAIFERTLSANGRSRVLIQLLQRLVPVELPEIFLKKTG
jgi:transcription antitermination factor NusG